MGYTTTFAGSVAVAPPLSAAEVASLRDFAAARHDDYTIPGIPRTPWCQWVPTDDGTAIEWDGGEKFIDSLPWMRYLIATFIAPARHVVNGTIEAQGERADDRWDLVVVDNEVSALDHEPAAELDDAATLHAAADLIDGRNPGNPIAAAFRVLAGWAEAGYIPPKMQAHIRNGLTAARAVLKTKDEN